MVLVHLTNRILEGHVLLTPLALEALLQAHQEVDSDDPSLVVLVVHPDSEEPRLLEIFPQQNLLVKMIQRVAN
jgi:hypothetical protein